MPTMRGPKPSHRPDFPPEFLAEAQALPRQRKVSFQLRQRAALVCLLQREPEVSHPEAAAETPMAVDSVRRWRRRWALGRPISRSSVWRILHEADLKPWQYEYWI